ncbi:E3 ubiquitin-protein ligase TRIM39-like [Pempheris klunzingeri]|uniref:E3 ubiquitin-protein ligase TRIM39-like n=1 Tax=Pempheris klunzingeri TaxID=3127111 RepID=UPI0039806B17
MASASSLLCEEQFLCPICLHVFSEPVSTPCGHNFCKACITEYWASCDLAQCPICKQAFSSIPQLQVNTGYRDMLEHFNNTRVRGEGDILAKPGEVTCDVCSGPKLKAQKTCLVCLVSYCQAHLEPHQRVTNFKKHKLVDPVSNLEERVCRKHDKMFQLYCRVDQMCVCFMCLKDDHAMHKAIPLELAFREKEAQLINVIELKENIKSSRIKQIRCSAEKSRKESKREVADVAEDFTALVVSLQRRQAELIELIEEKQRAAEMQAEDQVTQLEQEVFELRRRRSEIEQLLQTGDHLHLLQSWPSLCFLADAEDLFDSSSPSSPPFGPDLSVISGQSYRGLVKKAVAEMEKTLSKEMEMLLHEVRLSDGCEVTNQADAAGRAMTDEPITEAWSPPQDKLMMIQQFDAVDVTLDAYTAHSKLTVSEGGKQLSFRSGWPSLTVLLGQGFQYDHLVLAKEGFSSGKFYYEVRVSETWVLGVVKESINRFTKFDPSTCEGYWTFSGFQYPGGYFAHLANSDPVKLRQSPQTVGVFVDYEKGEVSFYDVVARTLMYSYTGCSFMETTPALKAFLYSMAGTSLSRRPKLYPIFGNFGTDSEDTLIITPVTRMT